MPRFGVAFALLVLLAVGFGNSRLWAEPVAALPDTQATQVITDEQTGVVTVLIKGREVLRIDDQGVHVQGNINYSGVITDTNGRLPDAQ